MPDADISLGTVTQAAPAQVLMDGSRTPVNVNGAHLSFTAGQRVMTVTLGKITYVVAVVS